MSGAELGEILARKGYSVREGEHVNTDRPAAPVVRQATLLAPRSVSFILPLPPTENEAWHLIPYQDRNDGKWKVRKSLTSEHRDFRRAVALMVLGRRMGEPLAGRLELTLTVHLANRRRTDISNRMKPLEDALTQARVYLDDSQIDLSHNARVIGDPPEHCTVDIREIA